MKPVKLFNGNLENCAGEILAAWFLANPNGPTAFAVGFIEEGKSRTMFYRWFHFTGGRTWVANELSDEMDMWNGNFGEVLLNSLLLFNDSFTASGEELSVLKVVPNIILTNPNPAIIKVFAQFLKLSTVNEDWGRHIYYVEKYGNQFFKRYEEEFRELYERLKLNKDTDQNYLAYLYDQHGHRKGFNEWRPNQYISSIQTDDIFNRWYEIVTGRSYSAYALYEFCQMWVGASATQEKTGLLEKLKEERRYERLDSVLEFFSRMNMPLLPDHITETQIAEVMGLR